MSIKVFWLEPTDRVRLSLRRFKHQQYDESGKVIPGPWQCPLPEGYHNAVVPVGEAPVRYAQLGSGRRHFGHFGTEEYHGDPRWPSRCSCGYMFADDDERQVFQRTLYYRVDAGEEMTLADAPTGAMWDAWWYEESWRGSDGLHLMVKLPTGHEWCVDSQASNCTKPGDEVHKCWVRHGDPKTGNVHVDKNGNTCQAGAGSIAVPGYHGFLHNGFLTDC